MITGASAGASRLRLHAIRDGGKDARPVLLLTGLGQQAVDWPENLVDWLVARGCQVIRPDHRDAGLSPLCGPAELADLTPADFPRVTAPTSPPPYRLQDMAADVLELLDRLDLPSVHVIGYSMGGMIAQILAACAPQRVRSLTSLMSSGGQPWIECRPDAWAAMARSICAVADPEERIRRYVEDAATFAGPDYPHDPIALRRHAAAVLQRSYRPAGIWRQAGAVRAGGDRRELLQKITAPTLLIHGTDDNCIAVQQAFEGQALITGSRLCLLPGAGHDLHPHLVPRIVAELATILGEG